MPCKNCASFLKHRAGGLCILVPAASDRQISSKKLVLDELPSADFLVFVDGSPSRRVYHHVGNFEVQLLQLLGVLKLLGCRLRLVCEIEILEGGR